MAISMVQHLTQQDAGSKNIILAIEEPELHLHPDAIHKLREVLEVISEKNQVIISTHSPLLVNRSEISRNLIVKKSEVIAAKKISDIRDVLGVNIGDNLHSANLVIMTEGKHDAEILQSWISELSKKIAKAILHGTIIFDDLGGANKLEYKISLWKNQLCDVYAFLDNDQSGITAYQNAINNKLITPKDASFTMLQGHIESEFEDLIMLETYSDEVMVEFGVDLKNTAGFRSSKKKWSVRLKEAFIKNGKKLMINDENRIKQIVALKASKEGIKCVHKSNQTPIIALVKSLDVYLDKLHKSK